MIEKLQPELEAMGHQVKSIYMVSGLAGITVGKDIITGGADPRRLGTAAGN